MPSSTRLYMTSSDEIKGDSLRAATGIRPSLHPTTINAIAEALKYRASKSQDMPMRVTETIQPLEVAMTAGKIAGSAIEKRQKASKEDDMELTTEEQQTIAGRVVGVIMRFDVLEIELHAKVSSVGWVTKYNEWATFGVLETELEGVDDRIKSDPLFGMSRAECLLAIFLKTVEIPLLEKAGSSVPDGSKIDFMDADRSEVLLN